ncbi:MAG: aldehyde dehydrogenase (NADP(+)) [Phycisphaeraceae bacterium]|nr:aldehyde dehydrogenase (NADP(+)) [Phycisphaeraceae bacterium]
MIAGRPSSEGQATFTALDPAKRQALPTAFHEATRNEIHRAATSAAVAFRDYRCRSPQDRAGFLQRIADQIENLGDVLINRAQQETGLPAARLIGERGRTTGQLRLFAQLLIEGSWVDAVIDRPLPQREPLPRPDLRRMLIPMGPVAVFAASNFPLAFSVAGGDTASALAGGNPVIVKAHPGHPGVSELVASCIVAAADATGLPEGVFSLIHGPSHDVGLALVQHPDIKAVAFTGSLRGGRALFDAAMKRPEPIPVHAEMGSTNPLFALPQAVRRRGAAIAQGFVQSMTLGAGQFCTKPGLFIGVHSAELEQLLETVGKQIKALPSMTMLSSGICGAYFSSLTRTKCSEGIRILADWESESNSHTEQHGASTTSKAAALVVEARRFLKLPQLHEEIFGPASIFVICRSKQELEEVAECLQGQLTATIHHEGDDLKQFDGLVPLLQERVGRLIFNGYPTGVEVCHAMQHGGPYPATTEARSTSVGSAAIARFVRPICFQNCPASSLPPELQDDNPRAIWRRIDGQLTRDPV